MEGFHTETRTKELTEERQARPRREGAVCGRARVATEAGPLTASMAPSRGQQKLSLTLPSAGNCDRHTHPWSRCDLGPLGVTVSCTSRQLHTVAPRGRATHHSERVGLQNDVGELLQWTPTLVVTAPQTFLSPVPA